MRQLSTSFFRVVRLEDRGQTVTEAVLTNIRTGLAPGMVLRMLRI
jgi:hypothetical protein